MRQPSRSCPFCLPRQDNSEYWMKVATLGISTLYLDRNQTYRGHCLLVFDPYHVEGLEHLPPVDSSRFMTDLSSAARAISAAHSPDLMNYASLGNVVRHLHWHIVPRYTSDPRWGGPIYTSEPDGMRITRLDEQEYREVARRIQEQLHMGTTYHPLERTRRE